MTIEELLDREMIRDTLARYCRAADHHDRALMLSTYWPDATDDHGAMFSGSAVDFVDMAMAGRRFAVTQHLLGQSTFAFGGTRARVETYALAYHRVRRDGRDPHDVIVGARLHDLFEKRDGAWRVLSRALVMDWFKTFDESDDPAAGLFGGAWPMGSKDAADPSYAFFA